MKPSKKFFSIVCLIIGAILYFLRITKYTFQVYTTSINIYPAAFFILLGVVLIFRELFNN